MAKQEIESIIFDMDGVLIDSPHQWRKIGGAFFQKIVPKWDKEKECALTGLNMEDMYHQLIRWGAKISSEEFHSFFQNLAKEIYSQKISLLPGVKEALEFFHSHNKKIALASSAPRSWVYIVLERFKLLPWFQTVVTGDDVEKSKPDPEIFLIAAKQLHTPPSSCLVFEDSRNGIIAAKKAGMYCIALTTTFEKEELLKADQIVSTFFEVLSDFSLF